MVAALTLLAFAPVVQNGFVDWDDTDNLTANPFFRGLGWPQLKWMWTTTLMGHYIPLTWMSFGVDYLAWGMNPLGYHLTNLFLHAANAFLVYAIALRLIRLSASGGARDEDVGVRLGAAFTALLFGLHPLRVESVAWATERRDVLCGLFVLASVLAYLRRAERAEPAHDRRWYSISLGFFALAALSKSMAVTLPAVLLLLDVYPLRRLRGDPRAWLGAPIARVWAEKVPFLAISAIITAVAFVAVRGNLASPIELGVVDRVALSVYQVAFYLWKSIVPLRLAALYELPTPLVVSGWPFALSAVVLATITTLAIVMRPRWPAILTTWVASAIVLIPVSGIFHNGPQIAADRYTYLAALPWAVLVGGGLRLWWNTLKRWGRPARALALCAPAAVAVALGALSWTQTQTWRDSERLWTHALAVSPSSLAHYNLGVHLDGQGRWDEAITHYRRALEIKPDFAEAHYNWGVDLARQGRWDEAVSRYDHALRLKPDHAEAHYNWGIALARQGQWDAAIAHYARALELRPTFAAAHNNWASALARQGRWREATAHYREAVRLKPDHAEAHHNLGSVLAQQELWDEAIAHYRQALAIRPDFPEARESLARLETTMRREQRPR
jgi:tetratricopeptide (TPR) repeat protein